MHRLFSLKSQRFAHQNDVDAIFKPLLSGDKVTAANPTGAMTAVGHAALQPHTHTGTQAIGITIQTLGVQRCGNGLHTANSGVDVRHNLVDAHDQNNLFRAIRNGGYAVGEAVHVVQFAILRDGVGRAQIHVRRSASCGHCRLFLGRQCGIITIVVDVSATSEQFGYAALIQCTRAARSNGATFGN